MTENTITHQVQAAKEGMEKLFRGGDIRGPAEGRGYQGRGPSIESSGR
jgi:hypothetical protein